MKQPRGTSTRRRQGCRCQLSRLRVSPVLPCLAPGPSPSPTGVPRGAAGQDGDGFAPSTEEAHCCLLFWFLLSQMRWAEGAGCPQLPPGGFPKKTSRALGRGLLLGEDPPWRQHYSSERNVHPPRAAQEPGSTLILPLTRDFPPLRLGEGCRCPSAASLTRSPWPGWCWLSPEATSPAPAGFATPFPPSPSQLPFAGGMQTPAKEQPCWG